MRRIFFQNFSISKRFSNIPLQNFFSKDFLLHKDNIKEVVNQFESLSIKDRLKILSFFLYQIKSGSHIYKNSKSVQWILREMNTDQVIRLSSYHFWRFSLQNILKMLLMWWGLFLIKNILRSWFKNLENWYPLLKINRYLTSFLVYDFVY